MAKESREQIPSYLLPWGSGTILSEIINNFQSSKVIKNFYLIANEEHLIFKPIIIEILKKYKIPVHNLFYIPKTNGQAETALIGCKKIYLQCKKSGDPILIYNSDTIIRGRNLNIIEKQLKKYDGYIDIFHSDNPGYSYVNVNSKWFISEISEKIVQSEYATSGLYGFKSLELYLDECHLHLLDEGSYLSSVYDALIKKGRLIKTSKPLPGHETKVLGEASNYLHELAILNKG